MGAQQGLKQIREEDDDESEVRICCFLLLAAAAAASALVQGTGRRRELGVPLQCHWIFLPDAATEISFPHYHGRRSLVFRDLAHRIPLAARFSRHGSSQTTVIGL